MEKGRRKMIMLDEAAPGGKISLQNQKSDEGTLDQVRTGNNGATGGLTINIRPQTLDYEGA